MATTDTDLTLYFKKKRTPPPSVLLLAVPNEKTPKDPSSPTSPNVELRTTRQQKKRQITPHTVGAPVNHSDNQDSLSLSSYGWQRHSDKAAQITPAPDVAYRNTYLEESRRDKSSNANSDYLSRSSPSRSPSPRSQHSLPQPLTRLKTANIVSTNSTSDSSPKRPYHQYRTVYDYIRESIKQIERQRNLKQNFSTRVKRPQNDDAVLRRVLGEKKTSAISKRSTFSRNDLRNPQSLVNYVNHSREQIRVLHTTTPNQHHQLQMSPKFYRQRTNLSQNTNDSLEKQRALMMTATVGNS